MAKSHIKNYIILLNMVQEHGTATTFTKTAGTNIIQVNIDMK